MGLITQKVLGCGMEPKTEGKLLVLLQSVAKLPSVQQDEDFIQSSQWDDQCQLSTGKTPANLSWLEIANF